MSNVMEWARKVQDRRSQRARRMDAERRAKVTFENPTVKEYGMWKRAPGRYDIVGIDTPEPKTKRNAPKKKVQKVEPEVKETETKVVQPVPVYEPDDWEKGKRRKSKKVKSDARGYSSSWYSKLKFKEDPVGASRLAAKALAAEQIEDLDDARAYLDDSRYDEIDHKTHRSDMETGMAIQDKMLEEFHLHEMDMMASPKTIAPTAESRSLAERVATLVEENAPRLFEVSWQDHSSAMRHFHRFLRCPETTDAVARFVIRIGGKGSRTLARDIRLWKSTWN